MAALTTADWDRLINQAVVRLPGASIAGLKGEMFDVLNEFFGNSLAWTEDISFAVVTTTQDYTCTPADNGQIIRLLGVVDADHRPVPANMPNFGIVHLAQPQNQTATFTATFAKNVDLPTTKEQIPIAPDWTLGVYGTNILDGLLGRMMSQSGKPYSDTKKGLFHLSKFNNLCNQVRVAALRRNTLGTQAWIFPQGSRTRSQRGGVFAGNDQRFT